MIRDSLDQDNYFQTKTETLHFFDQIHVKSILI